MVVSIDIADFEAQAASGSYGGLRSLSATTELMLITLYTYASLYRWSNADGQPLTDEQRDTIDNWVSIAQNELMTEVASQSPIGELKFAAFLSSFNVPDNWLECNGQTVAALDYPFLSAVFPYVQTSGQNLILPDWTGRVPRFIEGPTYDLVGQNDYTLSVSELPSHSHNLDLVTILSVFQSFTRTGFKPISSSGVYRPLDGTSKRSQNEGGGQPMDNRSASFECRVYVVAR